MSHFDQLGIANFGGNMSGEWNLWMISELKFSIWVTIKSLVFLVNFLCQGRWEDTFSLLDSHQLAIPPPARAWSLPSPCGTLTMIATIYYLFSLFCHHQNWPLHFHLFSHSHTQWGRGACTSSEHRSRPQNLTWIITERDPRKVTMINQLGMFWMLSSSVTSPSFCQDWTGY